MIVKERQMMASRRRRRRRPEGEGCDLHGVKDKAAFMKAVEPIHKEYEARLGKELLRWPDPSSATVGRLPERRHSGSRVRIRDVRE